MKKRFHPRRVRSDAGVALIEVLVSILLFSIGVLGLIGLQARAIKLSVDAEDRNRAALLADEAVTEMWIRKTPTLPSAILTAWQARVADPLLGGLPAGEATITVTGKQADVKITWKPSNRKIDEAGSQLLTRVVMP